MSVTIVVGGQYGGEGKGAVAGFLAHTGQFQYLVKTGGPNSSHSFGQIGAMSHVRMLPSGAQFGSSGLIYPPGCLIHVATFVEELSMLKNSNSIYVDHRVGIVTDAHMSTQKSDEFYYQAGSTRRGTGAATAERARRRLSLAGNEPALADYLCDTLAVLKAAIKDEDDVLVEGGQGYGLSNYHGEYPYVTSRDTTAASILGQTGIGIRHVKDVVMVVKAFPTRNPEGQGSLAYELFLDRHPDIKEHLSEYTTPSSWGGPRRRRVGMFDFDAYERACFANTPTMVAVTGLDRLAKCLSCTPIRDHYKSADAFTRKLSDIAGCPVTLEGWGPFISDMKQVVVSGA